jgi:amidase
MSNAASRDAPPGTCVSHHASRGLARIKERNGELNALVAVFEAEALAVAAERDRQAREGTFIGPLHGVPVTVKEQFWIRGKRSTLNAKMHKDFVAPEDAVVVERIRKSGAVILGHTNVPRFLLDYQVWGDLYTEGKNPFNTEYTPGGSTGEGAAAVAAGFSPLELGEDLGGYKRGTSELNGACQGTRNWRELVVEGLEFREHVEERRCRHRAPPLARTTSPGVNVVSVRVFSASQFPTPSPSRINGSRETRSDRSPPARAAVANASHLFYETGHGCVRQQVLAADDRLWRASSAFSQTSPRPSRALGTVAHERQAVARRAPPDHARILALERRRRNGEAFELLPHALG